MRDIDELNKRFRNRIHFLDGGLATELEDRGHDLSGKLWSGRVLLEDLAAIEQLHYDYLVAGADIIITASYQVSIPGMREAGYSRQDALSALELSVQAATRARRRWCAAKAVKSRDEQPLHLRWVSQGVVRPPAERSSTLADAGLRSGEGLCRRWLQKPPDVRLRRPNWRARLERVRS